MRTLMIPMFYFDSLTDWNSISDIQDTYPTIINYEAHIVKEFCTCKDIDRKPRLLHNLIDSIMSLNDNLYKNQILLLTELINSEFEAKFDLVDTVNKLAEEHNAHWRIALIGN